MKEKNIDIPIVEAVLLEDRAYVIRKAGLELAQGQYTLCVNDVSPVISDKTLLAEAAGEIVKVIDSSIVRTVKAKDESPRDMLSDTEDKIESLRKKQRMILDKMSVLETGVQSSTHIVDLLFQELPEDISWGRTLTKEAEADAIGLENSSEESRLQLMDAERELNELNRQITDLESVLYTLRTPSTRYGADILVRIDVPEDGTFELTLRYQVPQVCWRPRYKAELLDDEIAFTMEGSVWQNTGEDWDDIKLSFSTQRLSAGLEPPLLIEDNIYIQKKPKEEFVEIREQEIQMNGGETSPGNQSPEVPGIDDCGAVQNLTASRPATVPSDGCPYRFEIDRFTAAMKTDLTALPELSDYVHIRSNQTNGMGIPILAGPVDLIRKNGLAGRTSVLFVAPGEKFELAWGPDPDLRIHREEFQTEEKTGALSSWSSVRHDMVIRLSNLGRDKKEILVTERIPLSEIEKVQITYNDGETSKGFSSSDKNGMVTGKIELPPLGRRTLKLSYTIKRHKAVAETGA